MIDLKLKLAKEGINYSKFLYWSKNCYYFGTFFYLLLLLLLKQKRKSVFGMAGLDIFGLDDEC